MEQTEVKNFKTIDLISGWVVFAVASICYLLTIEPTASYWDCGEFICTAFRQEVGHPPGAPFFMIIGRVFSLFAGGDVTKVAAMINSMSALASGFTILFLFWSITHIARRIINNDNRGISAYRAVVIIGSGVVGALAYTFSDTFWFSAVEGEVYAMSSLFTAAVFWCILKWEETADEKFSNRWIILIAYLMGLSIGVHLLNLLAVPAIVFVYYFRKYNPDKKGIIIAFLISVAILGGILYGIIPGVVWLASRFELLFTNGLGAPFNTGTIIYVVLGLGALLYGIYYTRKNEKPILNTILLSVLVIIIGYSSFAMIVIRSAAEPPMDENNPDNVFALQSYLNREQYGDRPLFSGECFNSEVVSYQDGSPIYIQKNGKYVVADHKTERIYKQGSTMFFPRMYSSESSHIRGYQYWADIPSNKLNEKPSFAKNLKFLFNYQIGYMYMRYFLWNFVGRQNDLQGHDENVMNGNWISGIGFIDNLRLGDQNFLPDYAQKNKGKNKYYFLPLLLGILGMIYMYKSGKIGKQYFWIVMLFFFLTGIAIVLYLNQTPYQPRERDYAYAGSFYVFAIYIGFGVAMISKLVSDAMKNENSKIAIIVSTLCLFCAPVLMAAQNWDDHDRSHRYTARDFARNYLESCAPNAILFTNGDNDTFPLWYAQEVEGIRTDVRVVNLAYINTDWYIAQMKRKAYQSPALPISLTLEQVEPGKRDIVYYQNRPEFLLNEKFNAGRNLYQDEFDSLSNAFINLINKSNLRESSPNDYNKIVNQKVVNTPEYLARLVNTISAKATQYNISQQEADNIKNAVNKFTNKIANGYCPIKNVVDFIASESPETKATMSNGKQVDFTPTTKFCLPVDKQKVLANGTVSQQEASKIVDRLEWTHNSDYLRKGELAVLDILANNNWERPVYFAITVGSDAYMNLDQYFRLEGLAYRVVPVKNTNQMERGSVNSEILYKNVMEKFTWGGINDSRVYLDENNSRMLMNVKSNFSRLATQLLSENKPDSAKAVLEKCYQVMPLDLVNPSYYDLFLASNYYKLGEKDNAHNLIDKLSEQTLQEINYYQHLNTWQQSTVKDEYARAAAIAHEIVRTSRENKDTDYADSWSLKFATLLKANPLLMNITPQNINSKEFFNWYQSLNDNDKQLISIYMYLSNYDDEE